MAEAPGPARGIGTHGAATSLLLTMLGEFVRPGGGSLWTSTVVAGLGSADITERNARQAVARLGEQGIVAPDRRGRRTRWHLTEHGDRLLAEGTERIYSFGRRAEEWDGRWLVVLCSLPERERNLRRRFRTQLTFEGFGFVSPSIAVSAHRDRESRLDDRLVELGLDGSALTFTATTGALTDDGMVLEHAWDLDDLIARYGAFVDEFGQLEPDPAPTADASSGAGAFGATIRMIDAWRRFPFLDPELPRALLPDRWIGDRARSVFDDRRAGWHEVATAWFARCEDTERSHGR